MAPVSTGKGVTGRVNGRSVALGNRRLLDDLEIGVGGWAEKADALRADGDRDDPGTADQAERGLDPDDSVGRAGADDRSVGLGADRHGDQVGRYGGAGAGARATGVAVERIGVAALAAAAAPAAA